MKDHAIEMVAAKTAPPAVVSVLSLAGVSLQDWVYIATFIYVVLQSVVLVYNFGVSKKWWHWK